MIPPTLPLMSAASASTVGALLGPVGSLALVTVAVALVVIIAGLLTERRDLAHLERTRAGRLALVDAAPRRDEALVAHATRAA